MFMIHTNPTIETTTFHVSNLVKISNFHSNDSIVLTMIYLYTRALSKSRNSTACNIGYQRKWLTKKQTRMCLESYPQLAKAADLTLLTCQEMFKEHRWNCSNINSAPILTADLRTGMLIL